MEKKIYSKYESEDSTNKHRASVYLEENEKLGLHTIPSEKLKIIKNETRDIKPNYNQGDTVYLKNKITDDDYTIPENALCWVEDSKIMLIEFEKDKYEYKVYYELLYDFPRISLENQLPEFQELDSKEELLQFQENNVMFPVEQNELFNNVNDIFKSIETERM
jgi:hypothetical protein